jgi:asparagine synthase (glutamine-hydrolysing)
MCGITGIVTAEPSGRVDARRLREMTDVMTHRGPDSGRIFVAPGVGLGVRRLSIIDLEAGDQPIANEDSTITIVCNGEIYNHIELRERLVARGHHFRTRSDVEVIVHCYEDRGPACVEDLRGMFAFSLWDAPRRRLMLARDRLGLKPLNYSLIRDGLVFGSEQKAILCANAVERRIDVSSLHDLFTFGFVRTPRTLFADIRRLLPGHYLLFEAGRVSVHQYWDVRFLSARMNSRRSKDEWADALRAKLQETVRIHMRSDVPVGAWLSAGLDSSGITALMGCRAASPIPAFSIGFEDPRADEMRGNRTLADFPGYNLLPRTGICREDDFASLYLKAVYHFEDMTTGANEIPRLLLARLAASEVKVVLTGEGSDEVFGGYEWFRAERVLGPLGALPSPFRRLLAAVPPIPSLWPGAAGILAGASELNIERYRCLIGNKDPRVALKVVCPELLAELTRGGGTDDDIPHPDGFDGWDSFSRLQYYELKVRMHDFIEHSLDRASMAYSVEARVPYLDHEFVEFCAGIPSRIKMHWLREKQVLRDALRTVLPREIVERRKRGMVAPYRQWLRGDLPDFARALLSPRSIRAKGYFDENVVAHLLAAHRSGRADRGSALMAVLAVQAWDDVFIQRTESGAGVA